MDENIDEDSVEPTLMADVFQKYQCLSSAAQLGLPHPGDISEPSSLASVLLPNNDYPLLESLPHDKLIKLGLLSQLQLEAIQAACSKHLSFLPSGERCGFFIGDGAGVGKGRQAAGIIIDNYVRGRTKAVWVSTSSDLATDAQRDLKDLGCHIPIIQNLQSLDKATATPQEGIMFMTYSTLTASSMRSFGSKNSRLQQLIHWLGGTSFEGPLIFDECHKAKNGMTGVKGNGGTKVAASVLQLQNALPGARVVYASATGVSDVSNLGYCCRLGLWGIGSAFINFESFFESLKRKGVSFLEMLAMELKKEGLYVSRGLSFKTAEFSKLECRLTASQIEVYDESVALWKRIQGALPAAIIATSSSQSIYKTFWAAQQRFFKLLCVSMKVPKVVEEAQAALNAGNAVVIGLQSTGESALDSLNYYPGQELTAMVSTTREILRQFVTTHFPTKVHADAAEDADNGLINCIEIQKVLLQDIDELRLPPNALDELIHKLGGKAAVSEMTGRKARIVQKGHRFVYELRAKADSSELDSLNIRETQDFMNGQKLVAIVSDAASTGISLHADKRVRNTKRRMHFTIELPWSADKAIQQLGRSHRANQLHGPHYKLVFTSLGGERRFAAAVARRLQSLGALTRGDRRAASGLDLSEMNFDSPLGRASLRKMYDFIISESPVLPNGVKFHDLLNSLPADEAERFLPDADSIGRVSAAALTEAISALHAALRDGIQAVGISVPAKRTDAIAEAKQQTSKEKNGSDVKTFLNRLLGTPVSHQNLLFRYFALTLAAETRAAKAEGKLVEGVTDLHGQSIRRENDPVPLWVDPLIGLTTEQHDLSMDRGMPFEVAVSKLERGKLPGGCKSGFYKSRREMFGRTLYLLALQKPGGGGIYTVARPNSGQSLIDMDHDDLHKKYTSCTFEEAGRGWEEMYKVSSEMCLHGPNCSIGGACSVGKRNVPVTILSGSIVRIWDVLEQVLENPKHQASLSKSDRSLRIVRVSFCEGDALHDRHAVSLIGVSFPRHLLKEVQILLSTQYAESHALLEVSTTPSNPRHGLVPLERQPPGGHQLRKIEDPAPAIPRLLRRAFTPANKSIKDFFKSGQNNKRMSEQDASTVREQEKVLKRTCNTATIKILGDMGFSLDLAEKALVAMNGDINRATDWLLSN